MITYLSRRQKNKKEEKIIHVRKRVAFQCKSEEDKDEASVTLYICNVKGNRGRCQNCSDDDREDWKQDTF